MLTNIVLRPPPWLSTLFPYTTLFRSHPATAGDARAADRAGAGADLPHPAAQRAGLADRPHPAGVLDRRSRLLLARHHRSEEHTSELQSRLHLVCRLMLEKKKIRVPTS